MDEFEFQRILNLFPVVRSRDYHAESESSRQSTSQQAQIEFKEWQDGRAGADREITIQGIDKHDAFWVKLKTAAEKKVGAAEAEKFCAAFQRIHNKLVHEELSLDGARSFLSSS